MKKFLFLSAFLAFASRSNGAPSELEFKADRVSVDRVTKAAKAEGNIVGTCGVVSIRGESMERDAEGVFRFDEKTCVTTCTNDVGHTHWNVSGAVEYKANDHVLLRDCWLTFYEIPVFYLPYLWYPLGTSCGFSWMPGWASDWGAYLMTKYSYHLLGDPEHRAETYWLKGATRFDLRAKQGVALGENLDWSLDGFGKGYFKVYYAWDRSGDYDRNGFYDHDYRYTNWGSDVSDDRYAIEFAHRWDPTERDAVRVKGSIFSDSRFRDDFFRDTYFSVKNPFLGYEGNELAWEHLETFGGAGVSVSGPLNDFREGTARLPEFYVDVNPIPLGDSGINYESQTRIGYLRRQPAEFGDGRRFYPYAYAPGHWADYETFRFDTYQRLAAPFRTANDTLSVVPRFAYHGTYWHQSGGTDLTGFDYLNVGRSGGEMSRSIPEVGLTVAARGAGWIDDAWRHQIEPYFDFVAQKAFYSGASGARRPFVFDNLDASVMWEDQFAGRARNVPYTYYGVTPGFRQSWQKLEKDGTLKTILDVDLYAAIQFNSADYYDSVGMPAWYDSRNHKLAKAGSPNEGRNEINAYPGVRIKWNPSRDVALLFNTEYDSDRNRIALLDWGFRQNVCKDFSYSFSYNLRDYRWWDYSSSPYINGPNPLDSGYLTRMTDDHFNRVYLNLVDVGFEYQPLDWLRMKPFVRWDLNESQLDCAGTWIDYLVDCLGFRLILTYRNSYTLTDGYDCSEGFHVGFLIYLRAMGDQASNIFMH